MKCVTEYECKRYTQGQMTTADSVKLEEHLIHCDSCQALLAEVEQQLTASVDVAGQSDATQELPPAKNETPRSDSAPTQAEECDSDLTGQMETRSFLRGDAQETSEDLTALHEEGGQTPLPQDDLPKQIGRYRIDGKLGEGGFGVVYCAFDIDLQRAVALKVSRNSIEAPTDDTLSEARTLASLDHPNIVPVFDVGQSDHDTLFIVSKLIDGETLSDRTKRSPLSMRQAVAITAAIAKSLHFAHSKGLVHRDVKPQNIIISKE